MKYRWDEDLVAFAKRELKRLGNSDRVYKELKKFCENPDNQIYNAVVKANKEYFNEN